jgi:hypothetical protein
LFFSYQSSGQCLNGIYTIGGNNPDYPTIFAAINSLNQNGVCSPVTFNIRSGIYSEQTLTIGSFAGASEQNRVVFQSESPDSNSVHIHNSDYSLPNNIVLILNGAAFVTFNNCIFQHIGSTIMNCILLKNGASFNNITHCTFSSTNSTQAGALKYTYALVASHNDNIQGYRNEFNRIDHNRFLGGQYGIVWDSGASPSVPESNNSFTNNVFTGQNTQTIYTNWQRNMVLSGNNIYSDATPPVGLNYLSGFYLQNVQDSLCVTGNAMFLLKASFGMELVTSSTNANFVICNNYVQTGDSSSGTVFNVGATNSRSILVAYNTFRSNGKANNSAICNIGSNVSIVFRNNQCIAEGLGRAFEFSAPSSYYKGSHNNLFSRGTSLTYMNAYSYSNLTAFQAATNQDTGSISVFPRFNGVRTYVMNDKSIDSMGVVMPQINKDIRGKLRDKTRPDIGAYEFDLINRDVGLTNLNSGSFNCSGTNPIVVSLKNFGTDTVYSTVVHWRAGGISQTDYLFNGRLAQGDSATAVQIGVFNFPSATPIKVFIGAVNNKTDQNNLNDTILGSRTAGALNGIYTIGNQDADFHSLTSVQKTLTSNGICGPVTFLLKEGFYFERLLFTAIAGNSAVNTITFRSADGVPEHAVFNINPIGAPNTYGIQINGPLYLNFIKLSIVSGDRVNGTGSTPIDILKAGTIKIDSCKINAFAGDGTAAINIRQTDTAWITNNTVIGCSSGVTIIQQTTTASTFHIINNSFTDNSLGLDLTGMATSVNNPVKLLVQNNRFKCMAGLAGHPSTYGIKANTFAGIQVIGNTISSYGHSLAFYYIRALNGIRPALVNNFLSDGGVLITQSSNVDILFNSIMIDTLLWNQNYPRAALELNTDTSIVLLNNILSNTMTSYYGGALSTVSKVASPTQIKHSDYNDFYSKDTSVVFYGNRPYWNLARWKKESYDSNSVTLDPRFVSPPDLHITDTLLRGIGKMVSGITTDIDGDIRPNPPAMGADEYNSVNSLGVWPGDIDNNGIVENIDMLQLGLDYGKTGLKRGIRGILWKNYLSSNWSTVQLSGLNDRYADCNGDGSIDFADTLAITMANFGNIHHRPMISSGGAPGKPPLYFVTSSKTYQAGDWINVEVWTGTSSLPLSKLYGLAYTFNFDPNLVATGTSQLTYSGSWLSTPASMVTLGKTFESSGTATGAVCRVDHVSSSGFGKIASFRFQVTGRIRTPAQMVLNFNMYQAVDEKGAPVLFNVLADTIFINPLITNLSAPPMNREISATPNPFGAEVEISITAAFEETGTWELFNYLGQSEATWQNFHLKAGGNKFQIDTQVIGLRPGMYFLHWTGTKTQSMIKLTKL